MGQMQGLVSAERDGDFGLPQNVMSAQFSKEHYKNRMAPALEAGDGKQGQPMSPSRSAEMSLERCSLLHQNQPPFSRQHS